MAAKKLRTEKRETDIRIRVTKDERAVLTAAAQRSGLTLSAWVRLHLLKVARSSRT